MLHYVDAPRGSALITGGLATMDGAMSFLQRRGAMCMGELCKYTATLALNPWLAKFQAMLTPLGAHG
jgi:hypothetical protein